MKFLVTLLAVCVMTPWSALACTFPEPREFDQIVVAADKIFVIRVLDARLSDRVAHSRPVIESRIEVIETISGHPTRFDTLEFTNSMCGGVRVDVGHHYVVFTSQVGPVLRLMPADNSVISIESEYIPGFSKQNYRYPFLKSVRAFVNKEISADLVDPFPNIERNGTIQRMDCDPCSLRSK